MTTGVLIVLGVLILASTAALLLALFVASCDADEPDAAEAPDPVDEHFKTSPMVVAGSDIDRQLAIQRQRDNAEFARMCSNELADLAALFSAYYVTPEGDR